MIDKVGDKLPSRPERINFRLEGFYYMVERELRKLLSEGKVCDGFLAVTLGLDKPTLKTIQELEILGQSEEDDAGRQKHIEEFIKIALPVIKQYFTQKPDLLNDTVHPAGDLMFREEVFFREAGMYSYLKELCSKLEDSSLTYQRLSEIVGEINKLDVLKLVTRFIIKNLLSEDVQFSAKKISNFLQKYLLRLKELFERVECDDDDDLDED
ncbi:MAG: hypothetical protein V2A63_04275 [Patescibacteria group bacterium]